MGLDMYLRKSAYVRTWKSTDTCIKDATRLDVHVRVAYDDGTVDQTDFTINDPQSGSM